MPSVFLRHHTGLSGVFPLILGVIAALALLAEGGIHFLRYFLYRRTLTGKVVDIEPPKTAKGRRDRLIVEYTCAGQTRRLRSFFPYAAHKIGEEIPVRVSEKNSGRAMLPYDLKRAGTEMILGALLLLISGVSLIFIIVLG